MDHPSEGFGDASAVHKRDKSLTRAMLLLLRAGGRQTRFQFPQSCIVVWYIAV